MRKNYRSKLLSEKREREREREREKIEEGRERGMKKKKMEGGRERVEQIEDGARVTKRE